MRAGNTSIESNSALNLKTGGNTTVVSGSALSVQAGSASLESGWALSFKSGGNTTIETPSVLTVKSGGNASIESSGGSLTLKGRGALLQGYAESGSIDVKASGPITLKGSKVTSN